MFVEKSPWFSDVLILITFCMMGNLAAQLSYASLSNFVHKALIKVKGVGNWQYKHHDTKIFVIFFNLLMKNRFFLASLVLKEQVTG